MYKVYSEKGRFNIRKSSIKRYKGKVTHVYVLCNRASKVRSKFDINTLKEADADDEEKDGNTKRKRKTVSRVTNCPTKIGLKVIHVTECYKLFDFVENHNHPLMNENNMDLSRPRHQLHFSDYMYIHRASLSNIDEKPKLGDIFDTFDNGYNMYKVYSEKGRSYISAPIESGSYGWLCKVRGTPNDYRNFKRAVNLFIGDRDAQMIVDKMINWKLHVPEFSFEHHVLHDELVGMFWVDDTMKCNYAVFSDVVSFDATFRTKKYDFVFVPFTGIDHNQKCVTFGAALLFDETKDSYCWMLKAFLKVHQKQPTLALTDQDAALRNVVVIMFPDSKHRLCLGDLDTDSEFRKEFHKLIWNVCIGPEVFEKHWNSLITRHIFCVLRIHNIVKILETYIHRRWTKEALPAHLLEKRHRYGHCIEETDRLAAEVYATIEDCVGLLRSNTEKLTQFLTTVKEMKKQLEVEMQSSNYDNNKEALYADLLGVTVPEQVIIKNPKKSSNKGKCGGKGHNRRKCTGKKVMKEDEIQYVDEVYESDEDNASGEDNSSGCIFIVVTFNFSTCVFIT
nr:hypothetical protein [Tanacetum cinerariifolium]